MKKIAGYVERKTVNIPQLAATTVTKPCKDAVLGTTDGGTHTPPSGHTLPRKQVRKIEAKMNSEIPSVRALAKASLNRSQP